MSILVNVLRFMVNFMSFIIILFCGAVGVFGFMSGELLAGLSIGIGGVILSALMFGVVALLFKIHDNLASIRQHLEGGTLVEMPVNDMTRIEPKVT